MIADITIERADFERALKVAAAAVDATSPNLMVASALLHVGEGALFVAATDLTTTTVSRIEVETTDTARGAVSVAPLLQAVHAFPAGPMILHLDQGKSCGSIGPLHRPSDRYRFPMLAGGDFPVIPSAPAQMPAIDAPALRRILSATRMVCADLERPALNSVHLEMSEVSGKYILTAVATDGHRLHVSSTVVDGEDSSARWSIEGLVRARSVDAILRMLGEEARACVEGGRLFITSGVVTMSAQLCTEEFPPWRQVVPERKTVAWVDVSELRAALSRMAIVAKGQLSTDIEVSDGHLSMKAASGDSSMTAQMVVPIGLKMRTGANARYLLDAIEALGVEEVGLQNPEFELAPIPLWTRDESGQCVVMPMRA